MRKEKPVLFWLLISAASLLVIGLCYVGVKWLVAPKYESIVVDGLKREYVIHVPDSYDGLTPYPIILAFHGGGERGNIMPRFTGFNDLADQKDFIVVYPNGIQRGWSDGRGTNLSAQDGVDDVAFTNALLDYLETEYNIDTGRVYVTGISNGGFMAQRLLCEESDRFAAGVIFAANMSTYLTENCAPTEPVSIMYISGTDDSLVPYNGGSVINNKGVVLSANDTVKWWIDANHCDPNPAEITTQDDDPDDGTSIEKALYSSCDSGTEVALITVIGGGHTWPGSPVPQDTNFVGLISHEIDGSETAWEFMMVHSKE